MFIRKSHVKGRDYHAVVEGYRDDFGRSRQRMIVSLGTSPDISGAIEATKESITTDTEMFVRVVKALVDDWREVDIDPPPLTQRIAQKGLTGSEGDLEILDRVVDEELEGKEDELAKTSSPRDADLPLPIWAQSKLAQLRRRLRENYQRLKMLEALRSKL